MLNHVHLARFWTHAPSLAGRIDTGSLRALQRMTAHAQGRPADEVEHSLCLLLDHARFHPAVDVFVFFTPHAPAKTIAACGSSIEARAAAIHHLRRARPERPADMLARQLQLRFELVPEPVFAAWLLEMPPGADEEPASALRR